MLWTLASGRMPDAAGWKPALPSFFFPIFLICVICEICG